MRFYLGSQKPRWWVILDDIPLFLSYAKVRKYKNLRPANSPWVLDSGGFSELKNKGYWSFSREQYADSVEQYAEQVGYLEWVAPMDWMCEPFVLRNTGLSVWEHQKNTVKNFLFLRRRLGSLVVPVLQGWTIREYIRCIRLYERVGIDLTKEETVGVGSICRRNAHKEIMGVIKAISDEIGPRIHAFGVKGSTLVAAQDHLASADSLAWSMEARYKRDPLPQCTHIHCGGCLTYALEWRANLLSRLNPCS